MKQNGPNGLAGQYKAKNQSASQATSPPVAGKRGREDEHKQLPANICINAVICMIYRPWSIYGTDITSQILNNLCANVCDLHKQLYSFITRANILNCADNHCY
jgi:hypothetical protein